MLDLLSGLFKSGSTPEKLKIESWDNADRVGTSKIFSAFINPDEFTLNYTVLTESRNAVGGNGSQEVF